MDDTVILYGHRACPDVPPVMGLLKLSGVPFVYVDIRREPEAAERVRQINGGYESVPTLVFADGSTLTEPSTAVLRAKLVQQGYKVGVAAVLVGYAKWSLLGGVILWALLRFLEIL